MSRQCPRLPASSAAPLGARPRSAEGGGMLPEECCRYVDRLLHVFLGMRVRNEGAISVIWLQVNAVVQQVDVVRAVDARVLGGGEVHDVAVGLDPVDREVDAPDRAIAVADRLDAGLP